MVRWNARNSPTGEGKSHDPRRFELTNPVTFGTAGGDEPRANRPPHLFPSFRHLDLPFSAGGFYFSLHLSLRPALHPPCLQRRWYVFLARGPADVRRGNDLSRLF